MSDEKLAEAAAERLAKLADEPQWTDEYGAAELVDDIRALLDSWLERGAEIERLKGYMTPGQIEDSEHMKVIVPRMLKAEAEVERLKAERDSAVAAVQAALDDSTATKVLQARIEELKAELAAVTTERDGLLDQRDRAERLEDERDEAMRQLAATNARVLRVKEERDEARALLATATEYGALGDTRLVAANERAERLRGLIAELWPRYCEMGEALNILPTEHSSVLFDRVREALRPAAPAEEPKPLDHSALIPRTGDKCQRWVGIAKGGFCGQPEAAHRRNLGKS